MSKRGRPATKASPNKKAKTEHVVEFDPPPPGRITVPQIGSTAPAFSVPAVTNGEIGNVSLEGLKGKWVVLFFYPLDFTFVCPTELLAFAEKVKQFQDINCELLGASVDSVYSHLAWAETPLEKGGLGGKVTFPLLADVSRQLSTDYGALHQSEGHTLRATYLIDPNGVVRHFSFNEPPVGRSVEEVLRIVQAFQFHDKNGEVCPANWTPGSDTMHADPVKSQTYFAKHAK